MMNRLKNIPKEKYWDYFILVARFLLGWTFLRYGYGKLTGGQFGVSEEELLTPLQDLSLFRLSWYLLDHQPFKAVVGALQIICGLLLIINRTVIIGALMFVPLISTILLIDLTMMPPVLKTSFMWRLLYYILLDLLILWHYREKMQVIGEMIWQNVNTKYRFSVATYIVLPIMAIALEVAGAMPKILFNLILDPVGTVETFKKYSAYTIEKLL